MSAMARRTFRNGDVTLSYLDAGGDGKPLVALHAYWMEAGTYASLADALAPEWRIYALDLRGHGHSDKSAELSWDGFLGDLEAFLHHLGVLLPTLLIGNSIGGTIAFRYAARHPEQVRALVIEETAVVDKADMSFMRAWEGVYPTRDALLAKIGDRLAWSVEPSIRQVEGGWSLCFSPNGLGDAHQNLQGDFWADWTATSCPTLLIRGTESRVVSAEIMAQMSARRASTSLESFKAGHVVHHDVPAEFEKAVRVFLDGQV
jgi:esterase